MNNISLKLPHEGIRSPAQVRSPARRGDDGRSQQGSRQGRRAQRHSDYSEPHFPAVASNKAPGGGRRAGQLLPALPTVAPSARVVALPRAAGIAGPELASPREKHPQERAHALPLVSLPSIVPRPGLHAALVWSDEFDYVGPPCPRRWSAQTDANAWCTDAEHGERQWYTADRRQNAWVSGGSLKLRALREDWLGPESGGPGEPAGPPGLPPPPGLRRLEFTSARLTTRAKGDWLYGRVEVCARLPEPRRGVWPAIWLLPSHSVYGPWPRSGEIDLAEAVGHRPGVVHATVHTAPPPGHAQRSLRQAHERHVAQSHKRFVVYALIWTPDELRIFADGHCLLSVCRRSGHGDEPGAGRQPAWPFDQRFHLVLNLAIGGTWGGAHGIAANACPSLLEVKYVRVYQLVRG